VTVVVVAHPCWVARVIPYTRSISALVMDTAPATSKFRCSRSARLSRSSHGLAASTRMPAGTLMKKIQVQFSVLVRAPPSSTPAAPPLPDAAPHTPSARLRSLPSRKVVVRIDSAAGDRSAAPSPCRERNAIREPADQDSPSSSELTVNNASPTMNNRRRPSRSASRPPSSSTPPKKIAYAVITHCRPSDENPRSVCIDGSATFTIATSRTTMNWAATITASASQRLGSEPLSLSGSASEMLLAIRFSSISLGNSTIDRDNSGPITYISCLASQSPRRTGASRLGSPTSCWPRAGS
jgi:hypothetical protein